MFSKAKAPGASLILTTVLVALLSLSGILHAESLFLKDGSIIEGSLVNESDESITLKLSGGKKKIYQRKDILRVLFHTDYKEIKYLTKTDGTQLEVYIVDEDKTSYTYRLDLTSPREKKILKDNVNGIMKQKIVQNVSPSENASTDSESDIVAEEKEYFMVPAE